MLVYHRGQYLDPRYFLNVDDVTENMISLCRLFADDNSLQYMSYNVANIEYIES